MAGGGLFSIEFYEDESGRCHVEVRRKPDGRRPHGHRARRAVVSARSVLSHRWVEVCATSWGKQLGDGLFEFRVRHTAGEIESMFGSDSPAAKKGEKVLLRVFCHAHGDKIVLLLHGYDKGEDVSEKRQRKEIAVARRRLTEWQERQKRQRKDERHGRR